MDMVITALIMARRIRMTHRATYASFVVAVLLLFFAYAGVAQLSAPQTSGSSAGGFSSAKLGAPAAMGSSGLSTVPEDFSRLTLAPGFLVSLNVLDDADFGGTFRVDQQGGITVPILGTMHVAGETVSDARIQICNKLLEGKFLKDPQVNLAVLEYTPPEITIIGEVMIPGKYPLLSPCKLVDVLALAGGTTLTAANEVQITSANAGRKTVLVHYSRRTNPQAVEGVMVQPGDNVQVKRAGIVYVLGAVTRPGGFVMQEEGTISVLQAIALAYGTTLLAANSKIYIMHQNADRSVNYIAVNYKNMTRGKNADVQLRAADVLFVPTSKIKTIYSNTQQLMNQAALATIYIASGT
jgi:polysaccharide export outer membrane protein